MGILLVQCCQVPPVAAAAAGHVFDMSAHDFSLIFFSAFCLVALPPSFLQAHCHRVYHMRRFSADW